MLYNEDCKLTMQKMEENSIPFIITDPPYLLNFMNAAFDSQHKQLEGDNDGQKMYKWHLEWVKEAYRVLKPGGFLVAFGGTRTSHRLASAMEDVGFEIRDTICWLYGSGFPKSFDISKGIDKNANAEREVVGQRNPFIDGKKRRTANKKSGIDFVSEMHLKNGMVDITRPATDEAKKWNGWGTALKPAYEPIIIGMKPTDKNFVNNALTHGVAGINIDGSRISHNEETKTTSCQPRQKGVFSSENCGFDPTKNDIASASEKGRFPANLVLSHAPECKLVGKKKIKAITGTKSGNWKHGHQYSGGYSGCDESELGTPIGYADENGMEEVEDWQCSDDCPVKILDEQSGISKSSGGRGEKSMGALGDLVYGKYNKKLGDNAGGLGDEGGASRFFYTAKASTSERNLGLEKLDDKLMARSGGAQYAEKEGKTEYLQNHIGLNRISKVKNNHPTVKPTELMHYLVKMFSTPDGGTVYDPFTGSGTTLIACKILDRPYIGSEIDPEYYKIATERLKYDWKTWWLRGKNDDFVRVKEEIKNKFFEIE